MNRPTRAVPQHDLADHAPQLEMSEQAENLPATAPPQRAAEPRPAKEPRYEFPPTPLGNITTAIAAIMSEIKPVDKSGWNDFHKYQYAKAQDISRELTPLMGKHGIVIFQTEEGREMFDNGAAIAVRYRFTISHTSGEIWPEHPIQTGLSACRTNNGKFDDKALNKCHTAARKYFLLSLFQIPTADSDDADAGGDQEQRQGGGQTRPRRQVPMPNGKVAPHMIPVIAGEQPSAWAERFFKFIAKAETDAEIDDWYNSNLQVMQKIDAHANGAAVKEAIIEAMDARAAELNNAAFSATVKEVSRPAPAPANKAPRTSGGQIPDIPTNLRRTPPPPKPTPKPGSDAPSVEDVEEFFQFFVKKIEAAPDMDAVQIAWDTYVLPHIDGEGRRDDPKILPPDLDALDDVVNQKREVLGL